MNEQGTWITGRVRNNVNWIPFALVLAAGWGASWDYEPTSSSRRGRGLEALWVGIERIFTGDYADGQATGVLVGRLLLTAAVVLVGVLLGRRFRQSGARSATQQQEPQPWPSLPLS